MLDFFITYLNQSHGFSATNGQIIGYIGSLFMWELCVLPWVISFMSGVVWVLGFFCLFCDKYLY